MSKFQPKTEVIKFLDDICIEGESYKLLYKGFEFSFQEVRDIIQRETELGKRLYRVIEEMYNKTQISYF